MHGTSTLLGVDMPAASVTLSICCMQFQLHLPRYSSEAILKARLLTAIQNAGTRSDGGGVSRQATHVELEVAKPASESRTWSYILQPSSWSVGHRESLHELCARKCPCVFIINLFNVSKPLLDSVPVDVVVMTCWPCRVSTGTPIAIEHVLDVLSLADSGSCALAPSEVGSMSALTVPMEQLEAVKPGAASFFQWADADGDGRISFEEASAVIDFLGQDACGKRELWSDRRSMWGRHCEEQNVDPSLGPTPAQLGAALADFSDRFDKEGDPYKLRAGWTRVVAEASKAGFSCGPIAVSTFQEPMAQLLQMDVRQVKGALLALGKQQRTSAETHNSELAPAAMAVVFTKAGVMKFIEELNQAAWRWPDSLARQRQFRDDSSAARKGESAQLDWSSDEELVDGESARGLEDAALPDTERVASATSETLALRSETLALRQEVEAMQEQCRVQGRDIPGSWGSPEELLLWRMQSIGFLLENHPIDAYNGWYHKAADGVSSPADALVQAQLRNEAGMVCYQRQNTWVLHNTFADSDRCHSYLVNQNPYDGQPDHTHPLTVCDRASGWRCDVCRHHDAAPAPGYVVVTIGSSSANVKTADVPAGYSCPSVVSKSNWVGTDTYPDTFEITQDGTSLSARRTDSDQGWGMNLRITCTRTAAASQVTRRYRCAAGCDWDMCGTCWNEKAAAKGPGLLNGAQTWCTAPCTIGSDSWEERTLTATVPVSTIQRSLCG